MAQVTNHKFKHYFQRNMNPGVPATSLVQDWRWDIHSRNVLLLMFYSDIFHLRAMWYIKMGLGLKRKSQLYHLLALVVNLLNFFESRLCLRNAC